MRFAAFLISAASIWASIGARSRDIPPPLPLVLRHVGPDLELIDDDQCRGKSIVIFFVCQCVHVASSSQVTMSPPGRRTISELRRARPLPGSALVVVRAGFSNIRSRVPIPI